jgi:hypothetical protein
MAKGYNTSGDILTRTRDGQDLNEIWRLYQEGLAAFNEQRQPLIDLLSFTVSQVIEDVVQPGQERFEEATEFGIPSGIRPAPAPTARAYPFKWYDLRAAYTFQFLVGGPNNSQGASSAQLDQLLNTAMEADNRLQFELVMKALFNNANRETLIDNALYKVTALYNADGSYIPPVEGTEFDGTTHTHYLATGSAQAHIFDPGDFQTAATHVEHHGYTRAQGYNVIFLMNDSDATATIAQFARGVTFGGVNSVYDFIPSTGQNLVMQLPPGFTLVGGLPPNRFAGLNVKGSWGPYLVVSHGNIPSGYFIAVATAGTNTNTNVVGLREHANPAMQGLILKPGNNANYPLIDSYYIRGLGSGIGPRGAASVMFNGTAYAVPAAYAWSA